MTTKNARFYRDPWTILTFPKRNTSILYNNDTKEYDFYRLKPVIKPAPPAQKTQSDYPVKTFMFLAGALVSHLILLVSKFI